MNTLTTKCEECKGTGFTPDYMDCRNSSNNCCGGCDWVHKECPDCDGYGEIETDPYEYIEEHREDLHEEFLELKDKMVEFFSKEIAEEYFIQLSKSL